MSVVSAIVEPVAAASLPTPPPAGWSARVFLWATRALVAVTWASAGTFGAYVLVFYGGAIPARRLAEWNGGLEGLYDPRTPLATAGIAVHFAAGSVLLLAGPLQLFPSIRARVPAVHRWVGRVYTCAAMAAGAGGLAFIAVKGTIGGTTMSAAFALYGVLVALSGAQALRFARARRFERHRAWAIRLFALAIGSWLYRMDYGFWFLVAGTAGHTRRFDGPFDFFMDFFFYLPNLAIAEVFLRARRPSAGPAARFGASAAIAVATGFLALATYYFARYEWGPAIAARVG
jgi:hypothetical protein